MNTMFTHMHKTTFLVAICTLVILITGCSTKTIEKIHVILPPPPEEPKLVYLETLRGVNHYKETKALDVFIGKAGAESNIAKPYNVTAAGDVVYVTDTARREVFVFDSLNKKVNFIGNQASGKLSLPTGIALDQDGKIYVSDSTQAKILIYSPDGKLKSVIGKKGEFTRPVGIAINKALKRLYIVDLKENRVKAYTLDGEPLFTFGEITGGSQDGNFNSPTNIAIDQSNGNIVITDTHNFRVQIFDQDGKFVSKFGEIGDKPGMFSRPKGIGVDSEGHIYVADAGFNQVQIFDQNGTLMLFFGGHGGVPGKFWQLSGLYIDPDTDKLYVVDGFAGKVQVYQYLSKKWISNNPNEYKKIKSLDPAQVEEMIFEKPPERRPSTTKEQFPGEKPPLDDNLQSI